MEKCERSDWVCGGVENQFGPLRTTGIGHGNRVHSRPRDQSGEFFDFRQRSIRWLKRSNPCITCNIETNVTGCDRMARGKCRSANDLLYVLSDNFFIAHAILNGADGARVVERARSLRYRRSCVNRFGRYDAVVASRKVVGITGGAEVRGEIGGT